MKPKTLNLLIKVLGMLGSLMLTIFAGMFAMVAIACLVASIVEQSIVSVFGCIGAGAVAWIIWSVRKDVLV